eukprot:6866830-Pyramimonas_sp.AAC.1
MDAPPQTLCFKCWWELCTRSKPAATLYSASAGMRYTRHTGSLPKPLLRVKALGKRRGRGQRGNNFWQSAQECHLRGARSQDRASSGRKSVRCRSNKCKLLSKAHEARARRGPFRLNCKKGKPNT